MDLACLEMEENVCLSGNFLIPPPHPLLLGGSSMGNKGTRPPPPPPIWRVGNSKKHVLEGILMGRGGFWGLQRGWKG